MSASWHRWPLAARAFAILTVAQIPLVFLSDAKARHHVLVISVFLLLATLWNAAIVIWAQRWAWAVLVIIYVLGLVLAPFQAGVVGLVDSLVTLALLLAPGMLRHVGFQPPFPRRKGPLQVPRPGAPPT
jgi:hypothetical protein